MKRRRIISVLTVVLVFIGLLLVKVAIWVPKTFGDIPFEQVLFHVMVPMKGTDTSFVDSFIQDCLPMPSIISGLLLLFCILKDWKVSRDIKNGEFRHVRNNVLILLHLYLAYLYTFLVLQIVCMRLELMNIGIMYLILLSYMKNIMWILLRLNIRFQNKSVI